MKDSFEKHIQNLYSKDKNLQGASFQHLMKQTDQPVVWVYDIWNSRLDLLQNGDNRGRSIATQVLCNLASKKYLTVWKDIQKKKKQQEKNSG